MSYGYGGVKLFSKAFFKNVEPSNLDFSSTLTRDLKILPEISCITEFNSGPAKSIQGAFRECTKLYFTANDKKERIEIRDEARDRLAQWLNPVKNCDYRIFVQAGAELAISKASTSSKSDMLFINDGKFISDFISSKFGEMDFSRSPKPAETNHMKHELFFTTRIAGAFYDPFVLANVKIEELRDALSDGQLLSKNWLVETLAGLMADNKIEMPEGRPLRIVVLGGWIGTLSLMIFSWELPVEITSVDLDSRANSIAHKINYGLKFNTLDRDMYDVDYLNYDVIVNTSSEHIPDITRWRNSINANKIVIVQNNNYLGAEGHVSTVRNSDELRNKLNLNEVLYEGTRAFPQYDRYMLIGKT